MIVRVHIEVRERVIGSAQDVDGLLAEILEKLLAELEQRGGAIRVHLKNKMATSAAMIDRLVHHSVVLELPVPSYRTAKAKSKSGFGPRS